MAFDALFNIFYTPSKFQKTLKNNNLVDRKKLHKQLSNKLMNKFIYELR